MNMIPVTFAHSLLALLLFAFFLSPVLADEDTRINEAYELYGKAVPLEINSPERSKLLDQSADILKEVIANNPKSMDAHRKLLGVYLLQQDYSNAIDITQEAITLSPEEPKLFITLAFLYEHSRAYEYALAMLDQALKLDPEQELAREYKLVIQEKIEALKLNELHGNKDIMGAAHGKVTADSPHANTTGDSPHTTAPK